jgi:histidinol-phosphatase
VELTDELALALALADTADAVTLPPFAARQFTVEHKLDRTEVTEIDRAAEAAIVEVIDRARPQHGVLGEEHGAAGRDESAWQWVIDPIDGTSGYVRGIPVWATLIALTHDGDVMVAVVSAPALGRRWWSCKSAGTFVDGRPCQVSTVSDLAEAQVSVTFSPGWDDLGLTPALVDLASGARRARGFGDFWQHALVAEGALDVAIDAVGVAPYDVAAVRLLVEEAGGTFTDRHGAPTHTTGTAISTNGLLHPEVLRRLSPPAGRRRQRRS